MKENIEIIEIELEESHLHELMLQAHKSNVTLNTLISNIIKSKLEELDYAFENGTKPQLLSEQ